MTTPIQYPLINGVRHDYSSIELKVAGQIIIGVTSINYTRKRTRAYAEGFNPDPSGKTRGRNAYTCDIEMYLAEFNYLQSLLQAQAAQLGGVNGSGYGDVFFSAVATYTETGFDTVSDQILGCTLDSTDIAHAMGADPLKRKFDCFPLKILFNGMDDLLTPLGPPPGT